MGYCNNNNYVQEVMLLVGAVLVMISSSTTNAMPPPKPVTKWCVANPKAPEAALQNAKKLACGHVDCHPIEAGGKCYIPNTLISHASYAMTKYYNRTGDCEFGGASMEVTKNPSPNDDCRFPSHTGEPNGHSQSAPTKTKDAATTPSHSGKTKPKNAATSTEL